MEGFNQGCAGTFRLTAISGWNSDFSYSGIPAVKKLSEYRNSHWFFQIMILWLIMKNKELIFSRKHQTNKFFSIKTISLIKKQKKKISKWISPLLCKRIRNLIKWKLQERCQEYHLSLNMRISLFADTKAKNSKSIMIPKKLLI